MRSRENPFQVIYDKCNQGNSKEKLKSLPSFPRYIDVELTNRCNFRCLMCPTGVNSVKREKGMMSDDIFEKIAEEIKPHKTPVRFIRWGEPLLHPNLVEYVRQLTESESPTHINTNGKLLTEKMMGDLIDAGLDSIKFSFQGINRESYREIRNVDFFDELLEKVRCLYRKRTENGGPFIHISTTVTRETDQQVEEFKNSVKRFSDLVTVGKTTFEYFDVEEGCLGDEERKTFYRLKSRETVKKEYFECPEVFDKLSINWDGSVSACCRDYDNLMLVGELKANSLKDTWNCDKLNTYRNLLANMEHKKIKLCSTCYKYI